MHNIVNKLSNIWQLTDLEPVQNLSYNYVMTGLQNNTQIILKIGCDPKDIIYEANALEIYNQNGCIKLIDKNFEYNALLLERAIPGTSLKNFYPENDDGALEISVDVIKKLHSAKIPKNIQMPTVKDWFKDLFETQSQLDQYHINKARKIVGHLIKNQTKEVLLHGDLHHDNILLSQHGYLAIDPKGIIGDQAFEIYSFIKNPDPTEILKPKDLMLHRIELFSKYLNIDKNKLREACYA